VHSNTTKMNKQWMKTMFIIDFVFVVVIAFIDVKDDVKL